MLSKKFTAIAGAVAATTDDYFKNVTMLLHGDGTNGAQNNSFVDSSSNNYTITPYGSSNQGSFSHIGDNWSNYFDGSTTFLSTPSNAALDFGTGDFTIEAWVYRTSSSGGSPVVTNSDAYGVYNDYFTLAYTQSGFGYFEIRTSGGSTSTTGTINGGLNTWVHLAVTRQSGTVRLFVNGVLDKTVTMTASCTQRSVIIGGFLYANPYSEYFHGYISNLRLVKGGALYTSNFTPSTAPLTTTVSSGTVSLLTCQSNRFVDNGTANSGVGFTLTVNGSPSVQRFSPFNPTAAYSTATIGGSGYFDGYSDYLTVPYNSTAFQFTGDFTIECWVNPTSRVSSYPGLISNYNSYGANGLIGLFVGHALDSTKYSVSVNGSDGVLISTSTIKYKSWTHLAIVRSGSSMKLYVNGVAEATATNSTTITGTANNWWFGTAGDSPSNNGYNGYISNLRIIKGVAVYTGTFSPPALAPLGTTCANSTSAYSSTTNVNTSSTTGASLLLKFANAAIYDNAMMSNLETIYDAKISTSVKKYGTGSIAFDGGGDWLAISTSKIYELGSADFTVESWVYLSDTTNRSIVYLNGESSGYAALHIRANSGQWALWMSTSGGGWAIQQNSLGTASTGVWTHVAVVRNGTNVKLFINGSDVTGGGYTLSGSLMTSYSVNQIGTYNSGYNTLNGYIDDFRITKGYARYTSNFTVPSSAFPDK